MSSIDRSKLKPAQYVIDKHPNLICESKIGTLA